MPEMADVVSAVKTGKCCRMKYATCMVPAPQEPDRLDSWKQIAAYLNKSERTVRRWQELEGLPVHRHLHQQKGTVWAFKSELDGWLANRTEAPVPVPGAPDRSWLLPSLGAIVAIGLVFWIYRPAPQKPLETSVLTALPGMEYGASISPDGSRFAFFWGPEKIANHGIYTKSFGDEPPAPLILRADTDKFFYNPVWSPDGKTIAFLSRNPEQQGFLNVISSTGGPHRVLLQIADPGKTFFANHNQLSWTPDAASIVAPMATKTENGIYRISTSTAERQRLTPASDRLHIAPQLSRDGRRLAYMIREGPPQAGIESVYVLNVGSGAPPELVYHGQSMASGLTWNPPEDELIFCNAQSAIFGAFDSRLYRLSTRAGRSPRLLADVPCNTVSVHGSTLVYGKGLSVNSLGKLWTAATKDVAAATAFAPSSRYESLPAYSPDGATVAFLSDRSGQPEVWLASASGNNVRRLTTNGNPRSYPRWSPDGTRLLYAVSRSGIVVTPIAGGVSSRLPIDDEFAADPVWSRDGQTILYVSEKKLLRVRLDGSDKRLIDETSPHFSVQESPDGKYIYFSRPGSPNDLCRMPAGGGAIEVLTNELASLHFAMTDSHLYTLSTHPRELRVVPLADGPAKSLPPPAGTERIGNLRLGLGMTVSPDGGQLIWSIGNSAELDLEVVRNFR